jgi:UDP-N-acetylglucosamine--N-acetylmuramyl-(pentapeptide) pyrophosphoryl-undecaprenol N-acetylglucosamine transferase
MDTRFFFAGGGTGGHIYPAIAVVERIRQLKPDAGIHFFCSTREIDSKILSQAKLEFTPLPAKGFSLKPLELIAFFNALLKSRDIAADRIAKVERTVVIGVGGFVAAPACWAAHRLGVPIALINVDIVPGRANKLLAHWANEIFVQFDETADCFGRAKKKVAVLGCPLREEFDRPEPDKIKEKLGLDKNKKILLITGASSGSANINQAVGMLIEPLNGFSGDWQIVHLSGRGKRDEIAEKYKDAKIANTVLEYCDDMPSLLSAADLVIGRSGAVSVAEFAAAGVASICVPYPYHKDRHQYLNAGKLVEAGAAVIVDDLADADDRAGWLWEELEDLMTDNSKRREMAENCAAVAKKDAALNIAQRIINMASPQ